MRTLTAAVAGAVCLALASPALAALVERDLNTPGDGLVTRDTASGLDWLDLTQTTNTSYNAIVGGAGGWTAAGWRHATSVELCALFQAHAVTPSPCPGGGPTAPATGQFPLQTLVGITEGVGSIEVSNGFYDDGDATFVGFAQLNYDGTADETTTSVWDDLQDPTSTYPEVGHFLVREVPPVPATGTTGLLLIGTGLALAGAWRSRGARR